MPMYRHAAELTTSSLRHQFVSRHNSQLCFHQQCICFSSLEWQVEERQPPGTVSAIVQRQIVKQKGSSFEVGGREFSSMASWLVIIFAYVVIAVAVFDIMSSGSGYHPLF